jgi:hypothetical protein
MSTKHKIFFDEGIFPAKTHIIYGDLDDAKRTAKYLMNKNGLTTVFIQSYWCDDKSHYAKPYSLDEING